MQEPLKFKEKIDFLPPAYRSILSLSANASFEQWRAALGGAGFVEDAHSEVSPSIWAEGIDPMGPEPQAKGGQRHSLMHHPDGFILTMSSKLSLRSADGSLDGASLPVGEMVIYHQTDLGADIHDIRRGAFGSGGTCSLGDGTRVYTGHERMRSDPEKLAYFLAECHHHARPTPLARWGREIIHAEVGMFSPAPESAALGGPDFAPLRERFSARLLRDWDQFIGALPPEMACRVAVTGAVIPYPSGGVSRPEFRHAASTTSYWKDQLKAQGRNWPSTDESALMAAWSASVDRARSAKEGLAPLVFERESERVLGANPMHAVACFHTHPNDAENAVEVARRWLESLPDQTAQAWLGQRDSRGRTPAGVAFEVWMRDGALWRDDPSPPRVMDLFLERGWLGDPGELGQIAHDVLSERPPSWARGASPGAGHAMALDAVERVATRLGHEWLAPIQTPEGAKSTRAEALEALACAFDKSNEPARAYVEALRLRALVAPKPSSSASPRL